MWVSRSGYTARWGRKKRSIFVNTAPVTLQIRVCHLNFLVIVFIRLYKHAWQDLAQMCFLKLSISPDPHPSIPQYSTGILRTPCTYSLHSAEITSLCNSSSTVGQLWSLWSNLWSTTISDGPPQWSVSEDLSIYNPIKWMNKNDHPLTPTSSHFTALVISGCTKASAVPSHSK